MACVVVIFSEAEDLPGRPSLEFRTRDGDRVNGLVHLALENGYQALVNQEPPHEPRPVGRDEEQAK